MRKSNIFNRTLSLVAVMALISSFSMVTLAETASATGEIAVVGQVSVNGVATVSGATLVSGSVITTGEGSSATINLGKAGRVEVLSNSNVTLNFSASEIAAVMTSGKARVMNAAGIATTIATKDATVIADGSQSNSFSVEVECGHTHVDTVAGLVTMRTGTTDKQVAAGVSSVAGNSAQTGCQPCYRPDTTPLPVASIGSLPIAALLALVGGTIATAIIIGGSDNGGSGSATVVSPVR